MILFFCRADSNAASAPRRPAITPSLVPHIRLFDLPIAWDENCAAELSIPIQQGEIISLGRLVPATPRKKCVQP